MNITISYFNSIANKVNSKSIFYRKGENKKSPFQIN